ncbi:hypothetical protein BDN70DRAFT_881722 [Pholiota conissans]|uniref:Uncharacterized protein n=1 Tax=Pholiota conissans TaxID=109636 RepID=A0A9P5YWW3_9AGAR|nr:hypothetical protein BDN70DRAFT_881722 [Pholiota conissans]
MHAFTCIQDIDQMENDTKIDKTKYHQRRQDATRKYPIFSIFGMQGYALNVYIEYQPYIKSPTTG